MNLLFSIVVGVCGIGSILIVLIAGARLWWNQNRFSKHLLKSRQYQLRSLKAWQKGDQGMADMLLGAAQEELDRADTFIG